MLYSDSCIPTSHNSFSSSSNGFVFWPQQHLSIKDQLKIGVRGFMLDIYKVKDSVVLRHTSKSIPGVTKPLNGTSVKVRVLRGHPSDMAGLKVATFRAPP